MQIKKKKIQRNSAENMYMLLKKLMKHFGIALYRKENVCS